MFFLLWGRLVYFVFRGDVYQRSMLNSRCLHIVEDGKQMQQTYETYETEDPAKVDAITEFAHFCGRSAVRFDDPRTL